MSDRQDFLSIETRKVLDELGNAGSIVEWFAVTGDNHPVAPAALTEQDDPNPNAVVVVWTKDETATLITTAWTEDPLPDSALTTTKIVKED